MSRLRKIKLDRRLVAIVILLSAAVIAFGFIYDIGLNSHYFIKRDFGRAFELRQTGNCDAFLSYVWFDQDDWKQKCLDEKNGDSTPIENFHVVRITQTGDRAFLQVELKRDLYQAEVELAEDGHKLPENGYLINYEMQRHRGSWFIAQEVKAP